MNLVARFLVAAATVALVTLSAGTVRAACITGGALDNIDDCLTASKGGTECLLVWHVDGDGAGNPPLDKKGNVTKSKVECTDGEACDADGAADGVCTFRYGACINAGGTPAGGNACTSATLSTLEFKKPSDKDVVDAIKRPEAFFLRRALDTEVADALLPTGAEACTTENLELKVAVREKKGACNSPAGLKCLGDAECDDYCVVATKKNKSILKVTIGDGGSVKDSDSLKFFCHPATPGAQGSEALALNTGAGATSADLIGGPMAFARLDQDDHLLRNGKVRVIVRGPGRERSNMYQQGGHIIDADLVRADPADDRDAWSGVQTLINLANTAAHDTVVVLNDGSDGNPAIVRATATDDTLVSVVNPDVAIYGTGQAGGALQVPLNTVDQDLPISVQTDYILKNDADYVQVVTTIFNNGASALSLYVGEYLNPAGQLEAFGPGLGFGDGLLRTGSAQPNQSLALQHMSFQGRDDVEGVAYGVVFPSLDQNGPKSTGVFHQSGVFVWSDRVGLIPLLNNPQHQKPAAEALQVPAAGENSFRRWFVIGKTVADVTAARTKIYAQDTSAIQGTVTSNGAPVAGARIAILRGPGVSCIGGVNCRTVFTATRTDEQGFYRVFVPSASYQVVVRAEGLPYDTGTGSPSEIPVVLKKKRTAVVNVDLPQTGGLQVLTTENSLPTPAKVSIVGIPKSPDPQNGTSPGGLLDSFGRYFGSPVKNQDKDIFGLVDVRFTDLSGDTGSINLEPGDYQIVVSRGYEYSADSQRITVVAGATTVVNASVTQVVDSTGYVSIDTHVHSLRSPDARVSERERVVTMLAEGVDFFAATDHGYVRDFSSVITDLGADTLVKAVPSEETTSFAYGHYNIWPQTVDANERTGGALDWGRGNGFPVNGDYDLLPSEIYGSFNPANQVIQINHINGGQGGQFYMFGMDFEQVPPTSTQVVYRCSGTPQSSATPRAGLPCRPEICIGGANDGMACGGGCPGGACLVIIGFPDFEDDCPDNGATVSTCQPTVGSLGSFVRLDPAVGNLYDGNYTALEVLIEANRGQVELLLGDNLADWAGLLNQGIFKTGVADSDTHSAAVNQAGGPRTYVPSNAATADLIDATTLAQAVNAGRAIGSAGLFMTVQLTGAAAAVASHALADPLTVAAAGGGSDSIDIHVESPTWAQFDTIDIYTNSSLSCESEITFLGALGRTCSVTPAFSIPVSPSTVAGFAGGSKLSADASQPITVTEDTWVIVVARGTDGVSAPLFPMNPQDLAIGPNQSLEGLTDFNSPLPWNLGQSGVTALAFSNPLFFDFGGDGFCNNGAVCP